MSKGFSNFGRKPTSANPGNYIRDYSRSKKLHSSRHDDGLATPKVKLLPSTKPIPVELPPSDNSISAVGFLAFVVLGTFPVIIFLRSSET